VPVIALFLNDSQLNLTSYKIPSRYVDPKLYNLNKSLLLSSKASPGSTLSLSHAHKSKKEQLFKERYNNIKKLRKIPFLVALLFNVPNANRDIIIGSYVHQPCLT
jgi:hypothetical protein